MTVDRWTNAEKRRARDVFEAAAKAEEAELLRQFKARAAAAESMEAAWSMQQYLQKSERDFQRKYDFRYSELLVVLARLIREGRVERHSLDDLSADKLAVIDQILSL
ncbi:MAG: hypothetical protein H6933_02695 [Burkholderiaceae bacterium]|nr:hypothetical protein [Burkholderiaceae bacterium]